MDVGIIGHAHKCNTDSTSYSVGWEREREEKGVEKRGEIERERERAREKSRSERRKVKSEREERREDELVHITVKCNIYTFERREKGERERRRRTGEREKERGGEEEGGEGALILPSMPKVRKYLRFTLSAIIPLQREEEEGKGWKRRGGGG